MLSGCITDRPARPRHRHSVGLSRCAERASAGAAQARLVARLPLQGTDRPDRGGARPPISTSRSRSRASCRPTPRARSPARRCLPNVDFERQRDPHARRRRRGRRRRRRRIGARDLPSCAQRQLRDRFLGQEPRDLARRAGERHRRALRPRRRRLQHRGQRRHRLFPGADVAGSPADRAREHRRRRPRADPDQAALRRRHRLRARGRPAGKRWSRASAPRFRRSTRRCARTWPTLARAGRPRARRSSRCAAAASTSSASRA